jgi:hypothetical protein
MFVNLFSVTKTGWSLHQNVRNKIDVPSNTGMFHITPIPHYVSIDFTFSLIIFSDTLKELFLSELLRDEQKLKTFNQVTFKQYFSMVL